MKNYKKYLPIAAIALFVVILGVIIFKPTYSVKDTILADKVLDSHDFGEIELLKSKNDIQDLEDFISYNILSITEDKPYTSDFSFVAEFDEKSTIQ